MRTRAQGKANMEPGRAERTFDALVERVVGLKVAKERAVLLHKEAVVMPAAALQGLLHLRPHVAVVVFVLCLQLRLTLCG